MPETRKTSMKKSIQDHLSTLVAAFGALTTGLALASYAVLGFFSRYYADDYCMSGSVLQRGFWQAQIDQYVSWSNRFAGMFILSLSEYLGSSAIKAWTALVIVLMVVALAWTLVQFNRWLGLSLSRWLLVLLAELAVLFTILFAPQLYQSIFWRIGLITYTLPLVFLILLTGMVVRFSTQAVPGKIHRGGMIISAVVAFFAGGFSETYLVLQISLFAICLIAAILLATGASRRNWLSMIASVLAGSLLSLIVVLASPGNAVRQATMPPPPGFMDLARMVIMHAFLFMYRILAAKSFQVFLAILIPVMGIYGYYAGREMKRMKPSSLILILFLAPLVGFLLIAAIMAPAAYAQSSYPDGRVLILGGFVMAVLFIGIGILVGMAFSQLHQLAGDPVPFYFQVVTAVLAVMLLLYPLYDTWKNYALVPEYRSTAASWDAQDARVRAAKQAGESDVVVKGLNAPGDLAEIRSDPLDWVNQCAASYYDVKSITAGGQ